MTRAVVLAYVAAAVVARDVWLVACWVAAGVVETWRTTRIAVAA